MAFCRRDSRRDLVAAVILLLAFGQPAVMSLTIPTMPTIPFEEQYNVMWNAKNVNISDDGGVVLTMDQHDGSGFSSKKEYIFGYFSTAIKLVPGDSSGIVTAFYLSSDQGSANHDEMDFEFLGNKSGEPYILQTNVFVNGVGGREQRIYLWFDPREDFHTYSVLWNRGIIVFSIDGIPIRSFKNDKTLGIDYPQSKPMRVYSSIWNGEKWATRGGRDKINWAQAPFSATFKTFAIDACQSFDAPPVNTTKSSIELASVDGAVSLGSNNDSISAGVSASCATERRWWALAKFRGLTVHLKNELRFVKRRYMLYNYCSDARRYPVPPPECAINSIVS